MLKEHKGFPSLDGLTMSHIFFWTQGIFVVI